MQLGLAIVSAALLLCISVDARGRRHRQERHHEQLLRKRIQQLQVLLNGTMYNASVPHIKRGVSNSNGRSTTLDSSEYLDDSYTPWSSWSRCNRKCKQRRTRACQKASICKNSILKEQRSCSWGRCRKRRFVVKPIKKTRKKGRSSNNKLLQKLNRKIYSDWSEWSPCTRRCITKRYKSCKFSMFCGKNVLQEEAYCYVRGSVCEKWYTEQKSSKHRNQVSRRIITTTPAPYDVQRNMTDTRHNMIDMSLVNGNQCGVMNTKYPYTKIIGGKRAARGKWPWQVAILNKFQEVFCGGTLIAPQWVLTAAHCLRNKLHVRLGEHDLLLTEGTETEVKVHAMFSHPDYDVNTVDNDVALLQLQLTSRNYPDQAPRQFPCLPSHRDVLPPNKMCTIIGWGKERHTHLFGTTVLREAEVPIVSSSECRNVYEEYLITKNMVCAGYPRGRVDSCAGDSGGPLLCNMNERWTVMGITSFGEGCGRKGKYGIYAKLSNYVRWIRKVIRSNSLT